MDKAKFKNEVRKVTCFCARIGTSMAVGTAVAVYVPTGDSTGVKKVILDVAKFCAATGIAYKLSEVAVEGVNEYWEDTETLIELVKERITKAKEESD